MLLVLLPLAALALCLVVRLFAERYSSLEMISEVGAVVAAALLGCALLALPLQRLSIHQGIAAHEELRLLNQAPPVQSEYELATWRLKIANSNTALAKAKVAQRSPWVSWYYPAVVQDVEPIR